MAIGRGENSWWRYLAETAWGTSPTTGVMYPVAIVSESMKFNRTKTPSASIVDHGNVVTLIDSTSSTSGSSVHELRYGEFDTLFESAMASAWSTNVLKNGQVESSLSFERGISDLNIFHRFEGTRLSGFNLSVPADTRKVDITFNMVGETEVVTTGAGADWVTTNAGVTLGANPAAAKVPMYLVCGTLKIDNTAYANITSFDMAVDRQLAPVDTVDCDAPIELSRTGLINVTGSLNGVITDNTMYGMFTADTIFTLDLQFSDGTSTYDFVMDHCELTDSEQPISGPGDIINNSSFQSYYDTSLALSLIHI